MRRAAVKLEKLFGLLSLLIARAPGDRPRAARQKVLEVGVAIKNPVRHSNEFWALAQASPFLKCLPCRSHDIRGLFVGQQSVLYSSVQDLHLLGRITLSDEPPTTDCT